MGVDLGKSWGYVGLFIVVVLTVALFVSPPYVAADGETVDGSDSFAGVINEETDIDDIVISGSGDPTVPVRLNVTSGTLAMSTTTGLTFDGASSGSTLEFSGSLSNVNAALATLTYTRASAGTDTLEVSLVDAGEIFFPGNGHLYEYVSSTSNWNTAKIAAEGRTKYGATGYLATITSEEENDFVADRLENAGWMGASDSSVEGAWRWVTGPENGTQFWSGNSSGTAVDSNYENWNTGEPNDSSGEDCGQFLAGSSGLWNDLPCASYNLPGYVVEYGADGDMPTVASHEATIYTLREPDLTSPVTDTTYSNIDIEFTLYSMPQSGTLRLRFNGANGHIVTLDDLGVGTHSFTLDPKNPLANPNVVSVSGPGYIPDDTFMVYVQYTDAVSGLTLNQTVSNVTVDATAPEAATFTPEDNTTDVAIDSDLVIEFDENVGAASGDIEIRKASDDSLAETIPAGGGPISGNGTNTLTISPVDDLEAGTEYYVTIDEGAIQDLAGNDYAGISDDTSWSFTTREAPVVICEEPETTQTTASVACVTAPSGWGTTTWEVRYKKASDSSYTTFTLDDTTIASVALSDLDAETDYEIEFRFTNEYGTSEWARVEARTQDDPDNDDDGVLDTAEDNGPNDGDANNDGTPDSDQENVTSWENSLTGNYVSLEVSDDCVITTVVMESENMNSMNDSDYSYPVGMMDFTLDCGTPGYTADITHYYYGITGDFILRKFDGKDYSTISNATLSETEIDGSSVIMASYQVTDGGELDTDDTENGIIEDPAGLATQGNSLANTGIDSRLILGLSIALLAIGGVVLGNLRLVKYQS